MEENGKTRKFLERLANDPRTIKVLLVLICCLTVLLSALIVLAGFQARNARRMEQERAAVMAKAGEDLPQRSLLLNGYAEEDRLYISLADRDGAPLPEEALALRVRYPNGEVFSFMAEQGRLQLSRLPAGEYTVELPETARFAAAGPLYCTVYTDAYGGTSAQGTPVLDERGEQRYSYHFLLGPKGYLLSTQSHGESEVLPIDSDADGVPDYGLELVRVAAQEESGEGAAFWRKVRLFREDRHPVSDFAVELRPAFAEAEQPRGWQRVDGKMYYYSEAGYPLSGLQRIDGKLHYFDPQGVKARALGIDASYYNERIDWEMVKDQGIDFAIVRIGGRGWSSGALYGDIRSYEYLLGARKAGVKAGVYFYTTAVNAREAAEEARAALRSLKGLPLELPIFIDMEFSGEYPRGRADALNAAQRMEIIRSFCDTVRFAGYSAGIYSGQYFYQRNLYYPDLSQYTIWLANYTGYGELPDFSERYDIWQFSDRGTVPGVPGRADLNVMF